jgi:hypothetical protein
MTGAGAIVLSLLMAAGMIFYDKVGTSYATPEDISNQILLLCGDGLSAVRVMSY